MDLIGKADLEKIFVNGGRGRTDDRRTTEDGYTISSRRLTAQVKRIDPFKSFHLTMNCLEHMSRIMRKPAF